MKSRIEPATAKENVPNEKSRESLGVFGRGVYEPLAIVNNSMQGGEARPEEASSIPRITAR